MSRVLNIDLDLFQTERATHRPRTIADRLDGHPTYPNLRPWPPSELRGFLERCGLDAGRPLRGKFVIHHDEVFECLRDLISTGDLDAPLDVVHADAHADLGCGDASAYYVLRELVHRPVAERFFPKTRYGVPGDEFGDLEGLSEGNYLLFCIACRWLRSLVYVHYPSYFNDVPMIFFPDDIPEKGTLRLPRFSSDQAQGNDFVELVKQGVTPVAWEPGVSFERVSCDSYSNDRPFDFGFVALSPPYTHSSTDELIPVLREYITDQDRGSL